VNLVTSTDCRTAYREILQGYTHVEEADIYVKHFKEADLGFIDYVFKRCEKDLEEKGVMPKKDKLVFLKEQGYWTEEEENSYEQAMSAVKDAHEFNKRLQNQDQRTAFKDTIARQEEKLSKIQEERFKLLEPTVETYCSKKINEEYVRRALYKDGDCEMPLFTDEEFGDLSYIELADLVKIYNKAINTFIEENIKKICVNNFFLNAFTMCENDPVKFFGTSVLELTVYQLNLFSRGKYYKFILEEGESPPASVLEVSEDHVDHLVNYYDLEYTRIKSERERKIGQMKAQAGKSRSS
jgi:hypothetical protein